METIRDLKARIRRLEQALKSEQSVVESQRNSIRGERVVQERLTKDKLELETRLHRSEDQRRAVLLILERES
jgi:hypothetical protein